MFHGPVVYTDDRYALADAADDPRHTLLLPFVKHIDLADQREYRFFIGAGREAPDEFVDLDASPRLLASMGKPSAASHGRGGPVSTTILYAERDLGSDDGNQSAMPSILDLLNDPSVGVAARPLDNVKQPDDMPEITTTYSAVVALRQAVERVPASSRRRVAAAAWYADQYLRRLCSVFADPAEKVAIKAATGDIVVTLKVPDVSRGAAGVAISPEGTAVGRVSTPTSSSVEFGHDGPMPSTSTINKLKEIGLHIRPHPAA